MTSRRGLFAAIPALAVTAAGLAVPGRAEAQSLILNFGPPPPPPYARPVPRPRRGHIWEEGHYRWDGRRYVWHDGRWIRARRGRHYAQPRWDRDGDHWRYRPSRWDDHD